MPEADQREQRHADPLTMYELVFPGDLNAHGTMFGGRVIAQMDKCAGMCVRRWANVIPVTASIDAIQFCAPIHQGQMVETRARIVYVGHTSCMVKVTVYADEQESGAQYFCCEGYFTMVAMNAQGRPVNLPMIPLTDHEEWDTAAGIKQAMLERRQRAQAKAGK